MNRIILTAMFAIPLLALSQKDFYWRASICYEDFSDSTLYEVENKYEVDTFKFSDGNREYSIFRAFNVYKGPSVKCKDFEFIDLQDTLFDSDNPSIALLVDSRIGFSRKVSSKYRLNEILEVDSILDYYSETYKPQGIEICEYSVEAVTHKHYHTEVKDLERLYLSGNLKLVVVTFKLKVFDYFFPYVIAFE